jgi:hypothetical protein
MSIKRVGDRFQYTPNVLLARPLRVWTYMTRRLYQAIAVLLPNPHGLNRSTQHARDRRLFDCCADCTPTSTSHFYTESILDIHAEVTSFALTPNLPLQMYQGSMSGVVLGAWAETRCNPRSLSKVELTGIPSTCMKEGLQRPFDDHKGADSRIYYQYDQGRNCFYDIHPFLPITGLLRIRRALSLDLRIRLCTTTAKFARCSEL